MLLVTRAQESLLHKDKGGGSGSKGKPSQNQGVRGGHGKKPGAGGANGKQKKHKKFDITKVKCWNCEEMGHFSSDCSQPKKE